MSSTSSAITSIPNLQRVFLFSTNKLSRLTELASVHTSWEDCVHNYSHGIFESWLLPPSDATIDEFYNSHKEMHDRIEDARLIQVINAQSGGDGFQMEKTVIENSASVDVSLGLTLDFAFCHPVDAEKNKNEASNITPARVAEMKLEIKDRILTRSRRLLSGALVRSCRLGIKWIVASILESPSPFAAQAMYDYEQESTLNNDNNQPPATHLIDPEECYHYSGKPIFAAISSGSHDIVRFLIFKKPNIARNDLDLNERTPLFNACSVDTEMMKILIDEGRVDVAHCDYSGDDIFGYCACFGSPEVFNWLVYDPEIKTSRFFKKETPLSEIQSRMKKGLVGAASMSRQVFISDLLEKAEHDFGEGRKLSSASLIDSTTFSAFGGANRREVFGLLIDCLKKAKERGEEVDASLSNPSTWMNVKRGLVFNVTDSETKQKMEKLIEEAKTLFMK